MAIDRASCSDADITPEQLLSDPTLAALRYAELDLRMARLWAEGGGESVYDLPEAEAIHDEMGDLWAAIAGTPLEAAVRLHSSALNAIGRAGGAGGRPPA